MTEKRDDPHLPMLRRELGTFGAVVIGLGSVVGTGVFVSIGLGATVAGPAVVVAIALAALVATCNGLSSAQLAAAHSVSGGTYEYGYRFLRPVAGFTAGWMFLSAKSASAATAALGLSGYLLASLGRQAHGEQVALGVVVVALLTIVVLTGIRNTRTATVAILSVTLLSLLVFVVVGLGALRGGGPWRPFFHAEPDQPGGAAGAVLHATALMFVAYTGYGRIATLGEEVRDPARIIPRAIIITLVVSAALYVSVAAVGIGVAGLAGFEQAMDRTDAPLAHIADAYYPMPHVGVILTIGAMTAMLGVLLNLVLGLSRVWLAMGRKRDMPPQLARVGARGTPWAAVLTVGVVVGALVLIGNVRVTWSFSAFTVLVYYALTNLAALALPAELRRFSRAVPVIGLAGCAFLAFWVPWRIWLAGLVLIGVGLIWHAVAVRLRRADPV